MSETTSPDCIESKSAFERVTLLLPSPFGSAVTADVEPAELCKLVANDRRRYALCVLDGRESMALIDLGHHVAAREYDCAVDEVTSQQRKRVYVSLYQTHLSRLVDAGLVICEDGTVIPQSGIEAALEVYRTASAVATGCNQ